MIYPREILNHNRTTKELEELLLYCICVAGKRSGQQAVKLDTFLHPKRPIDFGYTPFEWINRLPDNQLLIWLKYAGLGQYGKLMKSFRQAVKLDVRNCTVEDLEGVFGIGPKTARLFLLMSRPNQRVAVLDTHILQWLNEDYGIEVPKASPSSIKIYKRLEKIFLDICDKLKVDPATFDLQIWSGRSKLQPL